MKKTKPLISIFCCLLFLASCNSYLSIEKRRYREGFYMHLNVFKKQTPVLFQSTHTHLSREIEKSNPDSAFGETISSLSAENNKEVNNILVASKSIQFRKTIFEKDTLPRKENLKEGKNKDTHRRKKGEIGIISILASLILFGLLFLIPFSLYPLPLIIFLIVVGLLLFGLTMLVASLFHKSENNTVDNGKRNTIPLALLSFGIVILSGFLAANKIIPEIFGSLFLVGLIASLIFLISSIRKYYVRDSRKLSSKAIRALLWSILSDVFLFGVIMGIAYAIMGGTGAAIIVFTALWLWAFISGYKTSVAAKKQIKEGTHWGNFFVIVARIILLTPAVWLIVLALFAALSTLHQ